MLSTVAIILLIVLVLLIFFILATAGWGIGTFNFFQARRQDIRTQWSNIITEYQRRFDLFNRFAESVKSYKKFERGTLTDVIKARAAALNPAAQLREATTKAGQMKAMKGLDAFFSKLLAVVEQYPNLKAVEQYNKLLEEIRITEDRVNVARTGYNDIVRVYNIGVKTFPRNIIAKMFNFTLEEFFKAVDEGIEKSPKLDLE